MLLVGWSSFQLSALAGITKSINIDHIDIEVDIDILRDIVTVIVVNMDADIGKACACVRMYTHKHTPTHALFSSQTFAHAVSPRRKLRFFLIYLIHSGKLNSYSTIYIKPLLFLIAPLRNLFFPP